MDLSNLSVFSTMMAAMASSMGLRFRTHIAPSVLTAAMDGTAVKRLLRFGTPIKGSVDKQAAHFYALEVTEAASAAGVVVRATSRGSSKIKLLRFAPDSSRGVSNGLDLVGQEDSVASAGGKGHHALAAFFFLRDFDTWRLDGPPSPLDLRDDPHAGLFGRLKAR